MDGHLVFTLQDIKLSTEIRNTIFKVKDYKRLVYRDPERDLKWKICHITNPAVYENHSINYFEKF